MPSEYRLNRRVLFHETDMAGVVHFSYFLRYMEEAEQICDRLVIMDEGKFLCRWATMVLASDLVG